MFTDELMEQKYTETHNSIETLKVLIDNVFGINSKNKINTAPILTSQIQQAHHIWKLFASKHENINPNGFKYVLLKYFPEKRDYINSILK